MTLAKIALTLALSLGLVSQSFAAISVNKSINAFALDAARLILDSSKGRDFFFSPYSIITAFGMAYAGAEGQTAREIDSALAFSPEIHKALGEFVQDLEADKAITSANRVWLNDGLRLKDKYMLTLSERYKSTAEKLDFDNDPEGSRKIINTWVSDKTNGRINDLIAKIVSDTKMILTNAVYFNAKWAQEFNENNTQPKDFDSFGDKVSVPMMMQHSKFQYAEHDGMKLVKLPYNGRMSMLVMLPGEGETGLENLDPKTFEKMLRSLSRYEVDLWLPKFRTEDSYELKDLFQELGVKLAFSNFADFSGMTDDVKLKIDAVLHKTFIEVDEKKTEAAAATAITMVRTTAAMPVELPKAIFHADRPFIYFIMDGRTDTILFMGRQTFHK